MSLAIKVENLIENYGQKNVIKGISFQVNKGEIFAILGTNGAGKTTTLECIESLKKYNSGKIFVNGSFGVQLQSSSLPANIKVHEVYTLFCKWNKSKVDLSIFESLGLFEIKDKQYCQMSTGQKRRLHLALALIGNPDIIFLDEPTAGLDVEGRVALHQQIHKLKCSGKTIILASHDMAEVESLCDRIAILKDGKIAFVGTIGELTSRMGDQCKIYIKTERTLEKTDYEQGYAVFTSENVGSINPHAKETLIQSMTVFGVTMGAILGSPTQLALVYGSEIKKSYKVGGLPIWVAALNNFISAFVHLIIISLVIFFISPIAFHAKIPSNLYVFFISLVIFIITSLAVGMVLGLLINSTSKLTMAAQLVFLPSIMLAGIMFPVTMLPKTLQNVGKVFPATWAFKLMTSDIFDAKLLIPLIIIIILSICISGYKMSKIILE